MDRLFKGGAQLLVGKIIAGLGVFFGNVFLARILSPIEYGTYAVIFSILVIGGLLAQFGLNIGIVRFVAAGLATRRFGEVKATIRLVAVFGFLFAALAGILLALDPGRYLFGEILKVPAAVPWVYLIGLWLFLYAIKDTAIEGLRAFERMGWYSALSGASTNAALLLCFFVVVLFHYEINLEIALELSILCWILPAGIAVWRLSVDYRKLPNGEGSIGSGELLSASVPAMGTFLLFILQGYAPIWIVSATLSPNETAILAAIMRLQEIGILPLSVVYSLSGPIISSLYAKRDVHGLEYISRMFATVGAIPYLIFMMILAIPGESLFGAIFGSQYASGYTALLLFCTQRLIGAWGGVSHVTLVMTGHQKVGLWISIGSTVILFGGGVLVTPHFGLEGMGCVAIVSMLFRTTAIWVVLKRRIGIATHAWIGRDLFARSFWAGLVKQVGSTLGEGRSS